MAEKYSAGLPTIRSDPESRPGDARQVESFSEQDGLACGGDHPACHAQPGGGSEKFARWVAGTSRTTYVNIMASTVEYKAFEYPEIAGITSKSSWKPWNGPKRPA